MCIYMYIYICIYIYTNMFIYTYICSRVSNAVVLQQLDTSTLTSILLEQQLGFFGKLGRQPASFPVRQMVVVPDLSINIPTFGRRRGRPRLEWSSEVNKAASELLESKA